MWILGIQLHSFLLLFVLIFVSLSVFVISFFLLLAVFWIFILLQPENNMDTENRYLFCTLSIAVKSLTYSKSILLKYGFSICLGIHNFLNNSNKWQIANSIFIHLTACGTFLWQKWTLKNAYVCSMGLICLCYDITWNKESPDMRNFALRAWNG